MSRLLVAVTATIAAEPPAPARARVNVAYLRALEGAGLVPLVVPPLAHPEAAGALLDAVAGLVLTGGEDVEPARYGAAPHRALGHVQPARDATELALVEAARARRMPTLAICRGIQLLNVALGGTLVQDLPSERPGPIAHERDDSRDARVHEIHATPGSRTARALGATTITANSFHHQAVDRLAPGLVVSATAPDGVVEGVETPDDAWWVLGVQWHPEELVETREAWDRGIFAAFARAVSSGGTRSGPGA